MKNSEVVIKVIGVGCCGGNVVDQMIAQGVRGVEFIAINTNEEWLKLNNARTQLLFGTTLTKGLGAGRIPDVGRAAAEEDRSRISELISGADMVFIIAGMGGGTGTGAAPVVAQIARELGIYTVAVVTMPFAHEEEEILRAQTGIKVLTEHVDALIIVPNDWRMTVAEEGSTLLSALHFANNLIQAAVAGIAEAINAPGLVNLDMNDVRTVMSEIGMTMVGSASASGPDRAKIAAGGAIDSPLLKAKGIYGACGVLVNITSSNQLKLKELEEVMECVQFAAEEATIIVASVFDENMGDELRVTIVATGMG